MTFTAMTIDAILLIIVALAIFVIIVEDDYYDAFLPRILASAAGICAFGQAMWLLGVWVPGASGFPTPRIGFDAMIALLAVLRACRIARLSSAVRKQIKRA